MKFDGLGSGEIFGRLFGVFYGPSFVAFFLAYVLRLIPADPWVGLSQWLGLALVIVALTVDVQRARLSAIWILVGAIPLIGWWIYGDRRQVRDSRPAMRSSAREWRTVFMPLSTERFELTTHLASDDCASRLRAKTMRLRSPGSWFAPSSRVPLQGRVDARRFALKIRHVMTRPMMLDEAKGTFRAAAT